ncbi:MAG: zinc-ribbon domain-containing protein [Lachnospiraceae bacterium]|nr:zinc-ribbon domain-containing protein [Lachnospiraceae bacterium]
MFCKNCGTNIPEGDNFCPNCGTPASGPTPSAPKATLNADFLENPTYLLWMGIGSIVLSVLGAILFGTIPALLGLALGIVALIFSIKVRKASGEEQGSAAFICSLLGVIFGAVFFVACTFCGACTCGTGCYGCVGSACRARRAVKDVDRALNDLNDSLNDITDEQIEDAVKDLLKDMD